MDVLLIFFDAGACLADGVKSFVEESDESDLLRARWYADIKSFRFREVNRLMDGSTCESQKITTFCYQQVL